MDVIDSIILFLIGLFAGAYGMIIGAGGGFIFVPALLLLFDVTPTIAAGTGLAVVWINSISGVHGYIKQKRIDYKLGLLLAIGALPGTFLGVWFANISSSSVFFIIFSVMLIGLGIFMLLVKEPKPKKGEQLSEVRAGLEEVGASIDVKGATITEIIFRKSTVYLLLTGVLMGIVSSFFGIGGGWLLVPILIYLYRINPHIATATSIFALCIYSTVGVLINVVNHNIDWVLVLLGGVGMAIGAQLGVHLSKRLSGPIIIRLLSIILIVVGINLFIGGRG